MIYDYVIFGGGVVGCSILNKLTRLGKSCLLIEKGTDVSVGSSKANSGIIHAGFDAKPETLKAKLNVRGNALVKKLCSELFVPIKNCGAVVVGNSEEEVEKLISKGKQNGVDNLKILKDDELYELVPNLKRDIRIGLYAKDSAVISPYLFTIALAEEAVLNGAEIAFNFETIKIANSNGVFEIVPKDKDVVNFISLKEENISSAQNYAVKSRFIINCTGAGYNEIAKLVGSEEYEITFKRGEYYLLDKAAKGLVDLTVFPLPLPGSKGILVTPTVDGNILLGPTSYESNTSVETTREGLNKVFDSSNAMIDNISFRKIIRVFAGVRNIVGDDFVIEKSNKVQNVINIAGICSPGLTAAPAIAEYVALNLLNIQSSEKEMQKRKPITLTSEMNYDELNELIKRNKDYGKIICRCENVSLGEIKDAINSPLKPKTVDGIKRRVRAGMGRCQGGYCLMPVIDAIAKENKISDSTINKEFKNSAVIIGKIGGHHES